MPQRGIMEALTARNTNLCQSEQFPDVLNPGLLGFLGNYYNLMTLLPLGRAAVIVINL